MTHEDALFSKKKKCFSWIENRIQGPSMIWTQSSIQKRADHLLLSPFSTVKLVWQLTPWSLSQHIGKYSNSCLFCQISLACTTVMNIWFYFSGFALFFPPHFPVLIWVHLYRHDHISNGKDLKLSVIAISICLAPP